MDLLSRINGYRPLIQNIENYELEVVIEDGNVVQKKKLGTSWWSKRGICKLILNTIYIIFVVALHLTVPIYLIVNSVLKRDSHIFLSNTIQLIFIAQYFIGIMIFNKKYGYIVSKIDISKKLYLFILLSSIALSISMIIMILKDVKLILYSDISDRFMALGIILLFIEKCFTYSVLLTNSALFFVVFNNHAKSVDSFLSEFEDILDRGDKLDISSIISEFSEIKSDHKRSVNELNCIFSMTVMISTVSAYLIVLEKDTKHIGGAQYFNISISIITILFYFYTINRVKNSVNDIKSLINSEKFQNHYREDIKIVVPETTTKSFKDAVDKVIQRENITRDQEKNVIIKTGINSGINKNLSEWIIIDRKLSENWESFQIFGFDIDDATLLQKAIFLVTSFYAINNFNLSL